MKKIILGLISLYTLLLTGCDKAQEYTDLAQRHERNGEKPQAFELYKKACELDNGFACDKVGQFYNVMSHESLSSSPETYEKLGDEFEQKAIRLYEKECAAGKGYSCAKLYFFKIGEDEEEGWNLLLKGCDELNDKYACFVLGDMIFSPLGNVKRREYTIKSCELGYRLACSNIGNHSLALKAYEKSCNDGNEEDCAKASEYYLEGEYIKQDLKKAKQFAEKACDLGDKEGCKYYKTLNEKGI